MQLPCYVMQVVIKHLLSPASLCTLYLDAALLQHPVCQAVDGCILSCFSSLQTFVSSCRTCKHA